MDYRGNYTLFRPLGWMLHHKIQDGKKSLDNSHSQKFKSLRTFALWEIIEGLPPMPPTPRKFGQGLRWLNCRWPKCKSKLWDHTPEMCLASMWSSPHPVVREREHRERDLWCGSETAEQQQEYYPQAQCQAQVTY